MWSSIFVKCHGVLRAAEEVSVEAEHVVTTATRMVMYVTRRGSGRGKDTTKAWDVRIVPPPPPEAMNPGKPMQAWSDIPQTPGEKCVVQTNNTKTHWQTDLHPTSTIFKTPRWWRIALICFPTVQSDSSPFFTANGTTAATWSTTPIAHNRTNATKWCLPLNGVVSAALYSLCFSRRRGLQSILFFTR